MAQLSIALLLALLTWNVIDIRQAVQQIARDQQSTHAQAVQANELVKYWLPPVSETRMATQCARCHR